MAGKSNAQPAKQAEPAKDAAVAETTDSVAEQAVTPPMSEGEAQPGASADESQGDEQPPEMSLHMNGKKLTANGTSEDGTPPGGKKPYELEPVCTIGPEDMESFAGAVFEAVASLIAGAGFFVRQGDEQASPFGKDILAASFRQGKGMTAVTADGRKFILKDGAINEAQ